MVDLLENPEMKHEHKATSVDEIQLEQLARELETDEGRKRLGDDAYREAMAAEKRKSIQPNTPKH
ncbi:MAG: hypothetical protein COA68_06475 [Oceanobacter sp.]|nr:MAG: hypothetical protein COB43_12295 [Oceanospirillales bacterium]PHS00285.1 MAG: hypothetical protein COA68_06475 [Oceanobacter sp.]